MKLFSLLFASLLTTAVTARSAQHVGKKLPTLEARQPQSKVHRRGDFPRRQNSKYDTSATQKYVVNGTSLPYVDFDIGESYAGLMNITDDADDGALYFWFFPSVNPAAEKEVLIWLNGGPGCSSLEGFLQENGPVLWQYGTYKPVQNPWTWVNLTNVVWVEQPIGTGFTQGNVTATSEKDVAAQFMGFFKNFVDTFAMQGYTVYISGESYAGYYVPYLADAFLNANDTTYYNLSSILVYDGVYSYDSIGDNIPTASFVDYWGPLLDLNATFLEQLHNTSEACGYTQYLNDNLVFPPKGPLPTPPYPNDNNDTCNTWNMVYQAASAVNPCFDIYQVATTCPLLWDVLGFPGSFDYVPDGAFIYFNLTDVQTVINAPVQEWYECSPINVFVNGTDNSPPSGLSVLPSVIDRADRVILGHGLLDFILQYNGTLLAVQNMTFGGMQGFQSGPDSFEDAYVPYHEEYQLGTLAGAGVMGQFHTERGLTVATVDLSGHMVPQYAPSAAYRHVEFLLGRIPDLGYRGPFTTMSNTSYGRD
ncbi:hypothetical protein LTR64_001460 [Lithohypha guttulata]|uniref:uncharacterized protein n=1 Tax=Lithohypha guttulata TaxID=1690604 RepID=UPI002DDFD5C9|nr:hypothetical protein LTR51_003654 [Lithohypha guttulata]